MAGSHPLAAAGRRPVGKSYTKSNPASKIVEKFYTAPFANVEFRQTTAFGGVA